eukprot:201026-Pyramimonas_sp.AAC.1
MPVGPRFQGAPRGGGLVHSPAAEREGCSPGSPGRPYPSGQPPPGVIWGVRIGWEGPCGSGGGLGGV